MNGVSINMISRMKGSTNGNQLNGVSINISNMNFSVYVGLVLIFKRVLYDRNK